MAGRSDRAFELCVFYGGTAAAVRRFASEGDEMVRIAEDLGGYHYSVAGDLRDDATDVWRAGVDPLRRDSGEDRAASRRSAPYPRPPQPHPAM